jgi:hypothetical protein
MANGGRIGFSAGRGIFSILKNFLKPAKPSGDDVKDFLSKRQFMKDLVGNTEKNKQLMDLYNIKKSTEEYMKQYKGFKFPSDKQIRIDLEKKIQPILNKNRKLHSTGGRAGFYTGGITDVEPSLDDIGHGADALNARTRLMSPGNQATTSTGLNYLLAEDNDNMRIPFGSGGSYDYGSMQHKINSVNAAYKRYKKSGGKKLSFDQFAPIWAAENFAEGGRIGFSGGGDPRRRAFLKLIAALGGGVAGLKSGLFGMGGKETAKKTITETVKQSAGSGQPPPYFYKLVEKIRTLGDDTLATKDKTIAKQYKDYTMEEDFAGNIEIIKKGANPNEEVYIKYTADDVELPNKKGFTKVEEYEEFTARPDADGKMKDVEQGVPDEVVQEGTVFEDNMTDFGMTKKADGGRIGFNTGKMVLSKLGITGSSRRFLEKIFGKQGFETMIENDPRMHRGMLEVVEMFRNRDKEGLKMYLQKFMPDMGDAEIEDFIIGDSGTEGISGQLVRLGSGREYKSLIDLKKQADNVRKLDTLDVTEEMIRKPNAKGGLQTMLGE